MSTEETNEQRELKNAIFAAKEAADRAQGGNNPMQPPPSSPYQQRQNTSSLPLEIPTGWAALPTKGLIYPTNSNLYGKDFVEIYGMSGFHQDILANPLYQKQGTTITEFIRASLVDKSFDVESMTAGDRNAIMVAIRMTGYGKYYSTSVKCPQCELNQECTFDLENLNLKALEVEPLELGTNQFAFELPITKKNVVFKLLTGKDERELLSDMEARKKKGLVNDSLVTTSLMKAVISIEGEKDRNTLSKFIKLMPAKDLSSFRKYIDKIDPSLDMKVDFECKGCDYSQRMNLPMEANFFLDV